MKDRLHALRFLFLLILHGLYTDCQMKKHYIEIGETIFSVDTVKRIINDDALLVISPFGKNAITKCRGFFENKIQNKDELYYGINTGFGDLCNIKISDSDIEKLQNNLVVSHACGMGDHVPDDIVRLILALKINNLGQGYSGIRLSIVERLVAMYNKNILPVLYQLGSLGASGDLSPLAHLALPILGLGEVRHSGAIHPANVINAKYKLKPLSLAAKEGLALLNGTQFSTAYLAHSVMMGHQVMRWANLTASMSIEAFECNLDPFHPQLHAIRKHPGQILVASSIRDTLKGSTLTDRSGHTVQDPYAFRCTPQVHGASMQALNHSEEVLVAEMNAVTDNPNILPEEDAILSGGNFHAQPIALASDYLAIALAEIGSISERRTYQLLSGEKNLPPFLVQEPGLNSGLMIPQYTAASMVSQNKQYCTPASVDSLVSSNGQEDHVSMAANAGTKLYRVVQNVKRILAIEFMTAAQAYSFRRPKKAAPKIQNILDEYRKVVPTLDKDRILHTDMIKVLKFLNTLIS